MFNNRSSALFIALALVASACGSDAVEGAGGDEELVEIDAGTDAVPASSSESTELASNESTATGEPAEFDGDATELNAAFEPVEPGTHRVTSLGTPFSFTVGEGWWVQPNEPGFFVLSDEDSVGPDDRDIVFVRATGLSDPVAPNANAADQPDWPIDDIDGWVDNLIDGITATNRQTVELGGRSAVRFDLRVSDDFECGTEFCAGFVPNGDFSGKAFEPGIDYRIHWIDEGEWPIVVITGSGLEGEAFLERAEAVLATLAFGDQQPHPNDTDGPPWEAGVDADVPAGRADFLVAGLSFELAEERFVFQNKGYVGVLQRTPSGVFMFKVTADLAGNALETADAVAESILADSVTGATEVEPTVESEYPVREFGLAPNTSNGLGFKWNDLTGRNNEWHTGKFTRLWVIDTPDGIVFVSAESREESSFEGAVAEAQGISASLKVFPAS